MAKTMASLQAFPSSLLSLAWSRALIPFPFPFERLLRRLRKHEHENKTAGNWGIFPTISEAGTKQAKLGQV